MSLRIIFAGTPAFAVPALRRLLDLSVHQVVGVLTQPDRPAGRGRQLQASPVKQLALDKDIPVLQPEQLKTPDVLSAIKTFSPDLIVVAAYGIIIPQAVLDLPTWGCLNIHASILPRWRGAAPIQYALWHGDQATGVTIMQMEAGLDTGPILSTARHMISPQDTSRTLHTTLSKLGADLLEKVLSQSPSEWQFKTQTGQVCHAPKFNKAQAQIDWSQSAEAIFNQIRAFDLWPVAFTYYEGQPLKVWQASLGNNQSTQPPGIIISVSHEAIEVSTGQGTLFLTKLQWPGKTVQSPSGLIQGKHKLSVGKPLSFV
jgi:methionyl-tRNA formyltransferase